MTGFGKPNRAGSNILAKYVIDDGSSIQALKNTMGPITLWGLSSTTEDTSLRNELYKKMDYKKVRSILAKLYPGGSVKEEYEKLSNAIITGSPIQEKYQKDYQMASRNSDDGKVTAIDILLNHVVRISQELEKESMA